ncbi:unnamed protein product, partial [Allacma fusca]
KFDHPWNLIMKVDIGLINDFIQQLDKRSKVQEILVVSFLRRLVNSFTGDDSRKLSGALKESRTVRSSRFLNLWMVDSGGWEVGKDLPRLNVTESTVTDLLEATVLTLKEILPMQRDSDGWTTIEALIILFHHWTIQLSRVEDNSTLQYSHQLLLSCCDVISKACSVKLCASRICGEEKHFIGSALLFFALTVDRCSALLSLNDCVLSQIIETVSICLLNPQLQCYRELFWRSSVLLGKVGFLNGMFLEEIVSKPAFVTLVHDWEKWKNIDWKCEAILAMLSDVIPVLGRDGVSTHLKLYKDVLLACINFKGLNVAGKNNAVFALGLLIERSHEDFQEEDILDFIRSLCGLLDNSDSTLVVEDQIFHDNVIGAIARISCYYLDPVSLQTVVPLLHTTMPLKTDVEENVPVLRFWNIWFRTPEVIPQYLPGLVDAVVRVATLFPSEDKLSSGLLELLTKIELDYPTQFVEILRQLKLQDGSPASIASSSMGSTFENSSVGDSYYRYDKVDDSLKDLSSLNRMNLPKVSIR